MPQLLGLELSDGKLLPAFGADVTTYSVAVPLFASVFGLTPRVPAGSSVEIEGQLVQPGAAWHSGTLQRGPNDIALTLRGPGGVGERAVKLSVQRSMGKLQQIVTEQPESIALDGEMLAVGKPFADDFSGRVSLFGRSGDTWELRTDIIPAGRKPEDNFGSAVALSSDTLVASTFPFSTSTGAITTSPGSVYVFSGFNDTWQQQGYLQGSNTENDDLFGVSVAIDGDTIVVGAPGESGGAGGGNDDQADNSQVYTGAAYVFGRTAGVWSQRAHLKGSGPSPNERFGQTVAISGDTIAVSHPGGQGGAYVFVRDHDEWTQQAHLDGGIMNQRTFWSVSLDADTLVLAVASDIITFGGFSDPKLAGKATVYVRHGTTWSQQAVIENGASEPGDAFGAPVSLVGNTLLVGARNEDSSASGLDGQQNDNQLLDSGAAFVFRRVGETWFPSLYIKPSTPKQDNQFGAAAVLSRDGTTIAVADDDSVLTLE